MTLSGLVLPSGLLLTKDFFFFHVKHISIHELLQVELGLLGTHSNVQRDNSVQC